MATTAIVAYHGANPHMTIAIELSKRNDGYMVSAEDPEIVELLKAGVVVATDAGCGYVIARFVHIRNYYHARYTAARRLELKANRGAIGFGGSTNE